VFSQPISPVNIAAIRRQVGFLFQDPDDQLFCPTVFEDVAFGPQQFGLSQREIQDRVRNALARVGLEGFERRAPHHLSGGEKRRVCLAGVLACEPSVLVLDEPTSNLDPRGKIIATHDLELVVEICPRAVVLDGGKVVADGPAFELLSQEELMLSHGLERPHILQHRHPHCCR
jgi:energy-coupling factor transporter ATP-binding protein EcfA2